MDSFIFKGKSSKDFKIIINSLPTISKPPLRVEEIEIDGVDGARYEELGYGCYEKKIKITITEDNIDSLIDWLKGEGDLILSNEPDKYYNVKIIEQIDFERLMKYEPTEIKFRVQPFKYQYQEEKVIAKTGSVEGTEIKISDVKAIQMQVDGRSIQNGEPTPETPVEIESVGYENLFNPTNVEQGAIGYSIGKNYDSLKQDSSIRIRTSNLIKLDSNKTYTISCREGYDYVIQAFDDNKLLFNVQNFSNSWITDSITFSGIPNIAIAIRKSDDTSNIIPSEIENVKLILVKGTQQHSYIPYGKYGIEVETTGKNLLNLPDTTTINTNLTYGVKNGVINVSGTYSSASYLTLNIDLTLKKGTYTLSTNASAYPYVRLYSNNVITISTVYADNGVKTFTIDKETTFNKIDFYIGSASYPSVIKPQIEVGVSNSQWEQHKTHTSTIVLNEPPRSLPNGIKDIAYIKNNKLYVDRKVGSVILDGSENITTSINSSTPDYTMFYLNSNYISNFIAKTDTNARSNYFIKTGNTVYSQNQECFAISSDNNYALQFKVLNSVASTIEEFKTWLSIHNTQVDYELATPITEEYGDLTILQLVDGKNIISNSEDANMIIDYIETLNVNNLGNHTSKPIFELEGVGKVDFILNNSNVFSYNFDDDGKVVIDSEKEDAYLGLTLKNRNMNGDFPIFNPGENKFTWDGLIKNISVSKKSRWL